MDWALESLTIEDENEAMYYYKEAQDIIEYCQKILTTFVTNAKDPMLRQIIIHQPDITVRYKPLFIVLLSLLCTWQTV